MKYRPLGKTGLQVSVIGLGTHQFAGEWGKTFSQLEVTALLQRALALGVNFIDTAECYGDHAVEGMLADALRLDRARWVLATKFGHRRSPGATQLQDAWSAGEVQKQLEDSLTALRTDYIDLYQFHSGSNAAFQNQELWSMLHKQVAAGKIRFLGVSLAASLLHQGDLAQLRGAEAVNAPVVQVVYNRLQTEAEREVLPFCQQHRLGVLARVPLAKGFLAGTYAPGTVFDPQDTRAAFGADFNEQQLQRARHIRETEVPPGQNMAQWALAWCLKHPALSAALVGCKSGAQLELNAAAADLVPDHPSGSK